MADRQKSDKEPKSDNEAKSDSEAKVADSKKVSLIEILEGLGIELIYYNVRLNHNLIWKFNYV